MKRVILQIIFLILVCLTSLSFSQDLVNFNISVLDNPSPGYVMFGPINNSYIQIYDNSGAPAYYKELSSAGGAYNALRILDNGKLAFYGENTLNWVIVDKNFNILDRISCVGPYTTNFHTLFLSPTGNYLLVANEFKTIDLSQKVQGGKTKVFLANNIIQELDQNKRLVFEWNCYDHIDVLDATTDVDLTKDNIDPYHINCARYDTDGNIIANFRNLDAFIKINRSNGNIMWICGGSRSKKNQFTFYNDTRDNFFGFSHQHDPKRLPNGNILLFDNGNLKPNPYSRAVEYQINEAEKTMTKVWEYRRTPEVYATFMGNAQRLPNGNTMIGWGGNPTCVATEVTPAGKTVFEILSPHMDIYQVQRHIYKMDAVQMNITSPGEYNFSNYDNQTGITLLFNSPLIGSGYTSVEKHAYEPYNISYASAQTCNHLPYRWVINNQGITNFSGKLYLDLSMFDNSIQKADLRIFWRRTENTGPFIALETSYNQQANRLEANISSFGEFFIGSVYLFTPSLSNPANNDKNIPLVTTLKWKSSSTNEKYRIQVSTSDKFDVVEIDTSGISAKECKLIIPENYTKYYWRVKAYNNICESRWTDAFSFNTIIGSPIPLSPDNKSKDQFVFTKFRWSTVKGAESYKFQVSEDSTFTFFPYTKNYNETSTPDPIYLKPLTKYYWRVQASGGGISGAWSEKWSFTTASKKVDLTKPGNAEKGIPVEGTLKWDTIYGIRDYHLQLSKEATFASYQLDSSRVPKNEILYKGLKHSTTYFWHVRGNMIDTLNDWSETWQFKTMPATPELKYPSSNENDISVRGTIDWLPVDEAKSYQLQLATDPDFKNIVIQRDAYTSSYKYYNLAYKTKYYWRVRSYDGETLSEWSSVGSFVTQSQLFYPRNQETKIPVTAKLMWFESFGATGYDLRIATDDKFAIACRTFNGITHSSFRPQDLKNNQNYYWSIRPVYKDSAGIWSEPFMFTTQLVTPVQVKPNNYDIYNTLHIELQWEPAEGAESYHVQVAYDSAFSSKVIDVGDIKESHYDCSGLLQDSMHFWRVAAVNKINESAWSEARVFYMTVHFVPLIAPNGGEVWFRDSAGNLIQWEKDVHDTVRIELLKKGDYLRTLQEKYYSESNNFKWIIPEDIPDDSFYQIRVVSINNPMLNSLSTNYFSVSSHTTDVDYNQDIVYIRNYPNPFSNSTSFEFSIKEAGPVSLKIYEVNGREIATIMTEFLQPGVHYFNWEDTGLLSQGTYYYKLILGNSSKKGMMTVIK